MSDSDVSHPVSQCWSVGRQSGAFLVDVNDWVSATRNGALWPLGKLQRAPAAVPRGSSCRKSRGFLIFLRLPEVVTAVWKSGQSKTVRGNAKVELWAQLKTARNLTQSWFTEPRWRRGTSWTRVYDVVPRADAAKKDVETFGPGERSFRTNAQRLTSVAREVGCT